MKSLSESLRIGALYRPGHTEIARIYNNSSCPLGAIYEGFIGDGKLLEPVTLMQILRKIPILFDQEVMCPVGESGFEGSKDQRIKVKYYVQARLFEIISHLNFSHHWPKEAIAEWLEEQGL